MSPQSSLSPRRVAWQTLYSKTLPSLAKAKDAAQPRWPVALDHCFARIILDAVVGKGEKAWNQTIKGPAIKTMSDEQVEACVELGERIARGDADLVALDEQSLKARGKKSKHFANSGRGDGGGGGGGGKGTKRSREERKGPEDGPSKKMLKGSEDDDEPTSEPSDGGGGEEKREEDEEAKEEDEDGSSTIATTEGKAPTSKQTPSSSTSSGEDAESDEQQAEEFAKRRREGASLAELEEIVRSSTLVPTRKRILLALLQVPRGKYTTYGAISDFLGSSPRAVGNGMRNNPFAPEVPCHRVLAADGRIGGYCGQWGEGDLIDKKRSILREEGLRFDGKGKVVGQPWRGFRAQHV